MHSTSPLFSGYIHDGQTRRGYIAEAQRLHPAVKFEYRPTLAAERDVIMRQVEDGDAQAATEVAAALIAQRVVSWNLRMTVDELVPIRTEHTRRLQPMLLLKLYLIILGNRAPDAEPNSNFDTAQADRELDAALDGRTSPQTQEGREGN